MTSKDRAPNTLTEDVEDVKTHALNEKLRDNARQGDLDAIYETLGRTPKILDQIDKIPFIQTPLHEAAEAGRTYFAIQILILKPSFGKKLNTNGESPLHLALCNRELAKRLISYDSELIRVKGSGGRTPLHWVAEAGDTDLLAEFLCACPESIKDLTIRDETAFHIAVKQRQVIASRLIFEWIWRRYNGELLIMKDDSGNTVLHIAVSTKQDQIVGLLVQKAPILRREKNSAGRTALEIAAPGDWTIKNILLGGGKAPPLPPPPPPREGTKDAPSLHNFLLSPERRLEQVLRFILYCRRDLSLDMRNIVLLVAVLIATATFDALGKSENQSSESSTSTSGPNLGFWVFKKGFDEGNVVGYEAYYLINTMSFTSSIAVMILVLSSKPFTSFLHLSLVFLALSYGYKMLYVSAWQTVFPVSLIVLVYTSKLYFKSIERAIRMEIPAIWIGIYPKWHACPPVPCLERLRMVYCLMG
ncbi:ankyrin repeat-containing protein BDA1-like [Rhododendron vialii]|uniref:ankyrin repeat-containing protein BDA1-like n=1 Tax=Rhododendron vialii TaxID=182163 RepID=UPI00265F938F|nr:ankyrin repeat-containing protein BDA1-like [Rhododendron vialii]